MSIPLDQIERDEYVEIGGLVLATPAWECVDFSALYDAPPVRGDDVVVPYHEGALSFRRIVGPRRVVLPMVVYGDYDRDGLAYDDARAGLRTNLDALKREVARPVQYGDGTKLLRHVFGDGEVRQAPCQVMAPLQVGPLSPISVRCTIDVLIPGGVLRSPDLVSVTSDAVAAGATGELVVLNPGTADQFETVLTLTGTATEVVIRNLTWDSSGDTFLDFSASIADDVVIDTGAWTVLSGGSSALLELEHQGHERWLPLLPGPNVLEISPTGGPATLKIEHYPAWL